MLLTAPNIPMATKPSGGDASRLCMRLHVGAAAACAVAVASSAMAIAAAAAAVLAAALAAAAVLACRQVLQQRRALVLRERSRKRVSQITSWSVCLR